MSASGRCGARTWRSVCDLPQRHPGPHQAHGFRGDLLEEWLSPIDNQGDPAATTTRYAVRYLPGTDLAQRWPEPTSFTYPSAEAAQNVISLCVNAARMEPVAVEVEVVPA